MRSNSHWNFKEMRFRTKSYDCDRDAQAWCLKVLNARATRTLSMLRNDVAKQFRAAGRHPLEAGVQHALHVAHNPHQALFQAQRMWQMGAPTGDYWMAQAYVALGRNLEAYRVLDDGNELLGRDVSLDTDQSQQDHEGYSVEGLAKAHLLAVVCGRLARKHDQQARLKHAAMENATAAEHPALHPEQERLEDLASGGTQPSLPQHLLPGSLERQCRALCKRVLAHLPNARPAETAIPLPQAADVHSELAESWR
jgi:hypothetical protein